MCVNLDGYRALRSNPGAGIDRETAVALMALPGIGKGNNTFVRWFFENTGSADTWPVRVLDHTATLAFRTSLLTDLGTLAEDAGNGEAAAALVRAGLDQPQPAAVGVTPPGDAAAKTIYHQVLQAPGVPDDLVFVFVILNSRRVRKTCLDWHVKTPATSTELHVLLLDKLAQAVQTDELIDRLEALPLTADGASDAVRLVMTALAGVKPIPRPLGLPVSGEPRRPCCTG